MSDGRRVGGEERLEQLGNLAETLPVRHDRAATVEPTELRGLAQFAIGIPAKLEIVRQNQIGQGGPIALQLLATLGTVQVGSDILAFDMADRDAAPFDDEIGRAAFDVRRLVEGANAGAAQLLYERLKRRAVAVLGRLPGGVRSFHLPAVVVNRLRRVPIRHRAPLRSRHRNPAPAAVRWDGPRRPPSVFVFDPFIPHLSPSLTRYARSAAWGVEPAGAA